MAQRKRRFLEHLTDPAQQWKVSEADLAGARPPEAK
jgi:polyphosphate kinase 2 (PPK2 family)